MASHSDSQALVQLLQAAMGVLDLGDTDSLKQTGTALCDRLQNPNIRIAIFGPFNYGKSTLLNALLGDKTVPIDLIPTTGAAILVRYGETLHTTITLTHGQKIEADGTEILQEYAVLDEQRRMRDDVEAVEVTCPHDFLKTGVEFLDLPGTDDQAAQDELVKHQLLTANVVIQLLDGRKLMTLSEREHLRDWLLDRGMETVVFVVNFLNLMEPSDQKQVMRRMRFVAESFRSKLPPGVSNLYRVDALPALRACLKGDRAQVTSSGLPALETALQTITSGLSVGYPDPAQIRIVKVQLQGAIAAKIQTLSAIINGAVTAKQQKKVRLQKQAQELIAKGFLEACQSVEDWAAPRSLLKHYGRSLTMALIEQKYDRWLQDELKAGWQAQKQSLIAWVKKAADFFQLPAPPIPIVRFPAKPEVITQRLPQEAPKNNKGLEEEAAPVAIATGLGWLMGGPIGAAVMGGASYVLTQTSDRIVAFSTGEKGEKQEVSFDLAYAEAAETYLRAFSQAALDAIAEYREQTHEMIYPPIRQELSPTAESTQDSHQLSLLRSIYEQLEQVGESAN